MVDSTISMKFKIIFFFILMCRIIPSKKLKKYQLNFLIFTKTDKTDMYVVSTVYNPFLSIWYDTLLTKNICIFFLSRIHNYFFSNSTNSQQKNFYITGGGKLKQSFAWLGKIKNNGVFSFIFPIHANDWIILIAPVQNIFLVHF